MHPRMQMLHWDFKDTAQILPLYAYSWALYTKILFFKQKFSYLMVIEYFIKE